MRSLRLLFSFVFATSLFSATAQPSRFSRQQFVSKKGDTLRYRLLQPDYDTGRRFPLVVFLHGSGERGSDNEAQLKWGVSAFATDDNMKQYPCYVLAPQCPEGQGWGQFTGGGVEAMRLAPVASRPMEQLMELVKKLCATTNVDTTRIYITGLSMGGYGTFDALQRYPKLFAAGVPVCGGGDLNGARVFARVPLWIFHGAEDPAVNVQHSLQMAAALYQAGAHPGLTILPEVGHFSWIAAYSDAGMLEWLFRQRK